MKKEDLIKLGLDEDVAQKVADASAEELKGFIPKSRFDEVNDEKKTLESTLKERDTQLETLKESKDDAETLKKTIAEMEEKNKQKDEELANARKESAIDRKLASEGISGESRLKMAKALLDLDKVEFDGEEIKGLDDQLKALKEDDGAKSIFPTEQKPNFKGAKPGEGSDGKPGSTLTKEDFNKMSYRERLDLYNDNREVYDQITQ